jgi:hypothetical protein
VTTIVVSQPMVFPWVGLFEQVRLADTFVHYDDVALPQGRSFTTRVQVKTAQGLGWLTIPIRRRGSQLIRDVRTDESQPWRSKHVATLAQSYARAPHADDMLALVEAVYALDTDSLCEITIAGVEAIADYFGLAPTFLRSSSLGTTTSSTQKLVDIVRALGGTRYVTGHGALAYLDHSRFEEIGVGVEYMQYERAEYPQLHGPFTASVTALDCIANCGRGGVDYIRSRSVYWKEFVAA